MAQQVQLLKVEELIDRTPLSKSMDHDIIGSIILESQESHTQDILGSLLYKKVIEHAAAFLGTPSTAIPGIYSTLIYDKVIPALIKWSWYECTLHFNMRITDKGIMHQTDVNAQQANSTDVRALRQEIKDKAEKCDKLIYLFICDNIESFPEYEDFFNNDGLRPNKKPYFSGIQLG